MALKATINKATIHLSDMDRNYYDTLNLTIAQHPSETDIRMMVRLLAFILNANEHLQFGKGVSDEEEAAIWQINYNNYRSFNGIKMATKFTIKQDGLLIKVAVKNWSFID